MPSPLPGRALGRRPRTRLPTPTRPGPRTPARTLVPAKADRRPRLRLQASFRTRGTRQDPPRPAPPGCRPNSPPAADPEPQAWCRTRPCLACRPWGCLEEAHRGLPAFRAAAGLGPVPHQAWSWPAETGPRLRVLLVCARSSRTPAATWVPVAWSGVGGGRSDTAPRVPGLVVRLCRPRKDLRQPGCRGDVY